MKVLQKKVKLSELHLNTGQVEGLPKNPRFIKDDKFAQLVKSIEEAPEMLELREVVAYDNNGELVVIMGNMRLRAMKELGIKETVAKILPQETPVEKLREYTVKDNVAFGQNDWDCFANEWDITELQDWGMDVSFLGNIDGDPVNVDDLFEEVAEEDTKQHVRAHFIIEDEEFDDTELKEELKALGEKYNIKAEVK